MASSRAARVRLNAQQRENLAGFLFVSPWIAGFIVFTLGPMVASVGLSLAEWDLIGPPRFLGWDNYTRLVRDRLFWQSLKVTMVYALGRAPLGIIVGLAAALLLNQSVRAISMWRLIYYVPVVLPPVAVSLLWMWIYNPDFGVLNWFLWRFLRIQGPAWLQTELTVLPALMIMAVWGMLGRNMIVYLSGLQGISHELHEAASIDGANAWHRFRRITVPLLTPIIFFSLVMGLIGAFSTFTQAYVMTQGGPRNASLFYIYYLYQNAFQRFRMGYASALAWVFFLVVMAFTLLVFRSSRAWVYYEGARIEGR